MTSLATLLAMADSRLPTGGHVHSGGKTCPGKKIQPMGFSRRREAITAPTVEPATAATVYSAQ
jgi:hypothetical protein